MLGWHYKCNGHEFVKLQELVMDREAWRVIGHKELDRTERLN